MVAIVVLIVPVALAIQTARVAKLVMVQELVKMTNQNVRVARLVEWAVVMMTKQNVVPIVQPALTELVTEYLFATAQIVVAEMALATRVVAN